MVYILTAARYLKIVTIAMSEPNLEKLRFSHKNKNPLKIDCVFSSSIKIRHNNNMFMKSIVRQDKCNYVLFINE